MPDHSSYRFGSTRFNDPRGGVADAIGFEAPASTATASRVASSETPGDAGSSLPELAEQCERLASPLCAAVVHVTEVLSSASRSPVAAARLYRAPAELQRITNHTHFSPPVMWDGAEEVSPEQWQAVSRTWSRWPELPGGLFAELAYRSVGYGVHESGGGEAVVRGAFAQEARRARAAGATPPESMVVAVLPVAEGCWAAIGMLRGMGERGESNATAKLKMLLPAAAAALQRGYEFEMHRTGRGHSCGTMSNAERRARLDELSPTEEAVLQALFIGKPTEKEVAKRLHRSHHTVHVHVKNIYRKLGVSSRKELRQTFGSLFRSEDAEPGTHALNAAA